MNFFSKLKAHPSADRCSAADARTLASGPSPETTLADNNSHAAMKSDNGVSDLMAAMDMLPPDKKISFLKAKRKCPNLVQTETTPLQFLQYDKYNYWKAAERLAMHWTEREKIFGERAFLPMTQTGNGALTKDDVVTLHTGSHARLDETPSGQPVMFTDRRRILSSSDRASRVRCFWYLVHHMSKEKNAQKLGILFVVLVLTPRPSPLDYAYMQHGVRILNYMPVEFHMHLLNNISKTGKFAVAQKIIQSVASYCLEIFGPFKIFTESCQGDLMQSLLELGCVPEGLPSSVGGTWKYEEYTKWCRRKVTEELYFEELHLPSKGESARKMTAEHKKERTKSLNVLHSRQKRERRKAEQAKMEEDCAKLQSNYSALQKENARLVNLLSQAQKIVQHLEGNDAFAFSSNIPNTMNTIPSTAMSSTGAAPGSFNTQPTAEQGNNQFQEMLNTLALQQGLTQQGLTQMILSQNIQPRNSWNQPINQLRNNNSRHPSMQGLSPLDSTSLNQQHMETFTMDLNSNDPANAFLPQTSINPVMQSTNNQDNMTLSVQQAMMNAMTMQNARNTGASQLANQHTASNNVDNTILSQAILSQNHASVESLPGTIPLTEGILPPHMLGSSGGVDPFEPIRVGLPSSGPDAATPAPFADLQGSSFSANASTGSASPGTRVVSLRESVPDEFAGLDIPEPDPLPESPAGVATYQTSHSGDFF